MLLGTIVNAVAIVVGSLVGIVIHKRFPERIKVIAFQGMGIATLVIGIQMALQVQNILVFIFSILAGGILGELLGLEMRLDVLMQKVQKHFSSADDKFTEGFVVASLLFCVGSMAIIGAINEGLNSDHTLLFTKSILDGFSSMAFASTYGVGVAFSALPLFLYQGGITLLAANAQGIFLPVVVRELTAVGGALIIGLGFNLLEIKKIKVLNLLPSIVVVIVLSFLFE
ncbi:MAG: DUF554 domain-containing protein [Synergistetes bacterium]|nr:DUF554 domain-containing protein [Synergistota bacterium]